MRSGFTPLLQLSSIRWDSAVRGGGLFFLLGVRHRHTRRYSSHLIKLANTLTACFESHNWIECHLKCPRGEKHALGQTASSHLSPFCNNDVSNCNDKGFKMVISSKKWSGIQHFFFFLGFWIWLGGRSVQSRMLLQNWQWEAECCSMSVLLKHHWSSVPRWLGAKWKIPILHRFVLKVDKTFIVRHSCNHIYQNKLSVIDLHGASDWRKITLTLVPIPELIKGGEKEIDSEHLGPTLDD